MVLCCDIFLPIHNFRPAVRPFANIILSVCRSMAILATFPLIATFVAVPAIAEKLLQAQITASAPNLTTMAVLPKVFSDSDSPFRILPLGDSLTFGCGYTAQPPGWYAVCDHNSSGSYRAALWASLNASGADVLFVGRETAGPTWVPASQRAHEGHPGWTIAALTNIVAATVAATHPDAVLLLAGTNDVGQGHELATIVADMTSLH